MPSVMRQSHAALSTRAGHGRKGAQGHGRHTDAAGEHARAMHHDAGRTRDVPSQRHEEPRQHRADASREGERQPRGSRDHHEDRADDVGHARPRSTVTVRRRDEEHGPRGRGGSALAGAPRRGDRPSGSQYRCDYAAGESSGADWERAADGRGRSHGSHRQDFDDEDFRRHGPKHARQTRDGSPRKIPSARERVTAIPTS
jgi:hypothetical protein